MNDALTTRRRLLRAGAVATTVSIAGCFGGGETEAPEQDEEDEPDPDLEIDGRYLSSAFPIEFVEPHFEETSGFADDARLAYVHWHGRGNSHWHQSPLEIAGGETLSGRTRFLEEGAEEIPLGDEETFFQEVHPTAETPTDLVTVTVDGASVDVEAAGDDEEEGELIFELWNDDGRTWQSPPLPIEVG